MAGKYPCPCCGHLVFDEPPGSQETCLVCFWEDDEDQLINPEQGGGPNQVSLRNAQRNFQEFGACEEHFATNVRPPTEEERLDPSWRPLGEAEWDPRTTYSHAEALIAVPSHVRIYRTTRLYYWRSDFYRRKEPAREARDGQGAR